MEMKRERERYQYRCGLMLLQILHCYTCALILVYMLYNMNLPSNCYLCPDINDICSVPILVERLSMQRADTTAAPLSDPAVRASHIQYQHATYTHTYIYTEEKNIHIYVCMYIYTSHPVGAHALNHQVRMPHAASKGMPLIIGRGACRMPLISIRQHTLQPDSRLLGLEVP